VTKTTEELGKTAGKDMAAAKATYPAISGIERTEALAGQVHREAKETISQLGNRSALLEDIADFILTRNA
jgi:geranylgeranyl diphosphate synthase, type II